MWPQLNWEFHSTSETAWTEIVFCSAIPQQQFWGKINTCQDSQERKESTSKTRSFYRTEITPQTSAPYNLIQKHKYTDNIFQVRQ